MKLNSSAGLQNVASTSIEQVDKMENQKVLMKPTKIVKTKVNQQK
jgi:hypothetical protein